MADQNCSRHSLVTDCAVLAGGATLLVRYTNSNKYDHEPGWFIPDDEMQDLEHPEKAAGRILREQVAITTPSVRLADVESFRGSNRTWHLIFHYVAEFDAPPDIKPSADLAAAEWFPLAELPPASEVAHHGWALHTLKAISAQ